MKLEKQSCHNINTLTIADYELVQDTGDVSLLKIKNKFATIEELAIAWAAINDDITDIIGHNDDYIEYLRCKIRYIAHYKEGLDSGDKFNFTLGKIEWARAKEISEGFSQAISVSENLLILAKMQGYHIKTTDISVKEYFLLIKQANNTNR